MLLLGVELSAQVIVEGVGNFGFVISVRVLPGGGTSCELLDGLLLVKGMPVGPAYVRVVRAQGGVTVAWACVLSVCNRVICTPIVLKMLVLNWAHKAMRREKLNKRPQECMQAGMSSRALGLLGGLWLERVGRCSEIYSQGHYSRWVGAVLLT
ncbi:hypothetical protein [Pseudomonas fluorescens]|uniref:hypothetical protein n=1 Tax=Pseudomonas fluorescens TaxID=294 RepID=UPI0020CA4F5B|nr:hypothetical protein [Pseudomonas fluorescens]